MKNAKYDTLITRFAKNDTEGARWGEVYPRPQMKRNSYLSLVGEWEFAISESPDIPESFSETIKLPFPPESFLSGIEKRIKPTRWLIYRKLFEIPEGFIKDRVVLHFGAVDQIATVFVNGKPVGKNEGGYIPFSFDITDHLSGAWCDITVVAKDELSKKYPYGKQKAKRGGMWYTPVSGIWQEVWLESLPKQPIYSISIEQNQRFAKITVDTSAEHKRLTLLSDGSVYNFCTDSIIIEPRDIRNWTPDDPYLYNFVIETDTDRIESYFALRSLEIKEVGGKRRMCLNGKPYFFSGLLDQGYFPDGIFLPATPEGYREDILLAKRLGFNTLRKHIKIEPLIFYNLCDKLGMVVFQDMVNNSEYSFFFDTALPTVGFKRARLNMRNRRKEYQDTFITQMEDTAKHLYNSPCVCLYTVFNEGWGQFSPDEVYRHLKSIDSSRFIDATSGWFYGKESDFDSRHIYFKAPNAKNPDGRPIFLSEFGGFSLRCEGHLFGSKNYGYSLYRDKESFTDAVYRLYVNDTLPLIKDGLSATVYTQLSDVEDETNGLITYDRELVKIDEARMLGANRALYAEFERVTKE